MNGKDITEKAAAQARYEKTMTSSGLMPEQGCSTSQPMREMLSQRFSSQLLRARQDRDKTERLEELDYLLKKNPEIARILDLIDALGDKY